MEKTKTGTTTLALVCKDGVVVAADQQSTMGYLVGSKTTEKIFKIKDNLAMTIAGTAGDAQALARLLKAELSLHELVEGETTIKAAATLLANILRSSYKGSLRPDIVQLILAGYDERGPQLFSLDIAGAIEESKDYAFSGSGSVIAIGVMEDAFRKDMTCEEGIKLLIRGIRAAKERDIFTGGKTIRIATITKTGFEWYPEEKIKEIMK